MYRTRLVATASLLATTLAPRARATTCADPPPVPRRHTAYYGPTVNPTGDPIGGGYGYHESGWPEPGDALVDNIGELLVELAIAESTLGPDRIWLNPAGDFDFTPYLASAPFDIPADTTLFSLRGTGGYDAPDGALIHADVSFAGPLFQLGDNVRLLGLRVRGPFIHSGYVDPIAIGFAQIGGELHSGGLEVANCELWGWPEAAIKLSERTGAYIHHNYIHHNQRYNLGYGVEIMKGSEASLIGNVFHANRHAIASDGRNTGYEAAWNIATTAGSDHAFDMHGLHDRCDTEKERADEECQPGFPISDAGAWMYIHHNVFLGGNDHGITIRGVVRDCAWIENNEFTHEYYWGDWLYRGAVRLENVSSADAAHVSQTNNHYHWSGLQWASRGTEPWLTVFDDSTPAGDMLYGDWDGDGRADLFEIDGNGHWRYRLSSVPAAGWTDLGVRVAGLTQGQLAVGDFDGNGQDDLFWSDGYRWHYFQNGVGAKVDLTASSTQFPSLRFGDFDADGKTDVFRIHGSQWQYSSGGKLGWANLAALGGTVTDYRFGDFVGSRRTDVFRISGGKWQVSSGARGVWSQINTLTSPPISELRFADFDGDHKTDVLWLMPSSTYWVWKLSHSGAAAWSLLRAGTTRAPTTLGFADMNGDSATDVLYTGRP
jgi:hypothetical protein